MTEEFEGADNKIELREITTDQLYRLTPTRLVIAGFTGRERDSVNAHLDELKELGVPVPDSTPVFYELDPTLLTNQEHIAVSGYFHARVKWSLSSSDGTVNGSSP